MKTEPDLDTLTKVLRDQLPFLSEQYEVESLGIFGSYAHSSEREDSDLDLLVTSPSLLKFIELENYLSDLLGVKVDLVMKDTLKPRIGARVLEEVMPL